MDHPDVWIVVVLGLVLMSVGMVYFLRNKSHVKAGVKGPLGMSVDVDAGDPPPGGTIRVEDAKANAGDIDARTGAGGVIGLKGVEAGQNIKAATDGSPKN
jgi:hypothetical protein